MAGSKNWLVLVTLNSPTGEQQTAQFVVSTMRDVGEVLSSWHHDSPVESVTISKTDLPAVE